MPHIAAGQPLCTVIVTVDADPEVMDDLVAHARLGVDSLFGDCPGFIGGALHVSDDASRLIQYLQWESESAYTRCRDHPKWDGLPSAQRFAGLVVAGRAAVDVRTYTVLTAHSSDSDP